VGVVLSGGNVDPSLLASVIEGAGSRALERPPAPQSSQRP
jgi:hypothetical protein